MKLYSYIIAKDYGLAPNPFWGELTLNVCKPKIRIAAIENDWVIGTGSKNVKTKSGDIKDYSGKLVFAMKVTTKMSMEKYDTYCKTQLKNKIPFVSKQDWRRTIGDSIYDYAENKIPRLRRVLHKEKDKDRDLSGQYTLLSTNFYYFGKDARAIPEEFENLIKNEQGHIVIDDIEIIGKFEKWLIGKFDNKKLYGEPQLQWQIAQGLLGKCDIACDD